MLTAEDWHTRFRTQAGWTEALRVYIFSLIKPAPDASLLEVGCGTGVITAALHESVTGKMVGLDLECSRLRIAKSYDPGTWFLSSNAYALPFADHSFSISLCHFLLLWLTDPAAAIAEMCRVTTPGGYVIALAEPDYGGRLEHPPEFQSLADIQTSALTKQGADPCIGRRLRALFTSAGLVNIQAGVLGGAWSDATPGQELDTEWRMLEHDLAGSMMPERLMDLKNLDRQAHLTGSRVSFVPTFYAFGQVSG